MIPLEARLNLTHEVVGMKVYQDWKDETTELISSGRTDLINKPMLMDIFSLVRHTLSFDDASEHAQNIINRLLDKHGEGNGTT